MWATAGYRKQFGAIHVNALKRMVDRHYIDPHRFVCVTNARCGFEEGIELVLDRADFAYLPSPAGRGFPACYRRLRLFAPDASDFFGERFVCLDLDTIVLADLKPLWNRPDDFIIWRDPIFSDSYCGSMVLMRAGARARVWDTFDEARSPHAAAAAGFKGSDQAWIRHCLGPGEVTWGRSHGVYSYRMDLDSGRNPPPRGAKIVFFHGKHQPWDESVPLHGLREHWG